MSISNLIEGVGFTGIMLTCWKTNGNKPNFWKECNLKPIREEKLFEEGNMHLFKNEFAENLFNSSPLKFIQIMAAIRHKYIDNTLIKLVNDQLISQVVILGAGFDVRATNLNFSNVKYFEVDNEKVQDIKREIYKENNINQNAKYISIDYVKDNLLDNLKMGGVNFEFSTLFIYEGNSMYNSKDIIHTLFKGLNLNFRNYYVIMDYLSEDFINKNTGIPEHNMTMDNNANIKAELINGYNDINNFIDNSYLQLIENFSFESLAYQYGIHNDSNIPEMKDYSIVYANKIYV